MKLVIFSLLSEVEDKNWHQAEDLLEVVDIVRDKTEHPLGLSKHHFFVSDVLNDTLQVNA